MAVKFRIRDGGGSSREAFVDENHALLVTSTGVLPASGQGGSQVVPFRQYFTSSGKPGGSNDMRVAGTLASPIEFYIPAIELADRYVSVMSFLIADASATLSDFGAIAALTNGVRVFWESAERVVDLHDSLKTNFNFIRFGLGVPAFGAGVDSFRAANVIGASEAYIPVVDLTTLVPPYGVRLDAQTDQRLVIQIRDNTSAVDAFNCIAYGFDRLVPAE